MRDIITVLKSRPHTTTAPNMTKNTHGVKRVKDQLEKEGWTRHQYNGSVQNRRGRGGRFGEIVQA